MSDERLLTDETRHKICEFYGDPLSQRCTNKCDSCGRIMEKTTKHFNEVVIPAAVKAAREELIAEIETHFKNGWYNCELEDGHCRYAHPSCHKWQQLKQKEG
jgi:hypothetical protein